MVRLAESKGVRLDEMGLAEMRKIEPRITRAVFGVLGAERSAASRTSLGGTAPRRVRTAVRQARKRFL